LLSPCLAAVAAVRRQRETALPIDLDFGGTETKPLAAGSTVARRDAFERRNHQPQLVQDARAHAIRRGVGGDQHDGTAQTFARAIS
jgi:hypothetical protein